METNDQNVNLNTEFDGISKEYSIGSDKYTFEIKNGEELKFTCYNSDSSKKFENQLNLDQLKDLHEKLKEYNSTKDIFSYINNLDQKGKIILKRKNENLIAVFFCEDDKPHEFFEITIYKNKGFFSLKCCLITLVIIIAGLIIISQVFFTDIMYKIISKMETLNPKEVEKLKKINVSPFTNFGYDWALVTSGTKEKFNSMTIGWGEMGTLWGFPVIQIFIKPIRYTFDFLKENDIFTVSFYDKKYRKKLGIIGTVTGRNNNKVDMVGFTPQFLENGGITYKQASVTYVLKKILIQQIDKNLIPEFAITEYYTTEEPHYIIIGKVESVVNNQPE